MCLICRLIGMVESLVWRVRDMRRDRAGAGPADAVADPQDTVAPGPVAQTPGR